MNILVTGGAGYIGSHTCLELLQRGYGAGVAKIIYHHDIVSLTKQVHASMASDISGSSCY